MSNPAYRNTPFKQVKNDLKNVTNMNSICGMDCSRLAYSDRRVLFSIRKKKNSTYSTAHPKQVKNDLKMALYDTRMDVPAFDVFAQNEGCFGCMPVPVPARLYSKPGISRPIRDWSGIKMVSRETCLLYAIYAKLEMRQYYALNTAKRSPHRKQWIFVFGKIPDWRVNDTCN